MGLQLSSSSFSLIRANVKDAQEVRKERTFMLVIREDLFWDEGGQRKLAAESTFCCEFSVASLYGRNAERSR